MVATAAPGAACQLLDKVGACNAQDVGHDLHREPSRSCDGNCQTGFFPRAAVKASLGTSTSSVLRPSRRSSSRTRCSSSRARLIATTSSSADGNLTALGHQLSPSEQQTGRDTVLTSHGRDHHAGRSRQGSAGKASGNLRRVQGFLDQSQFAFGTAAPSTLAAGADFNAHRIIGHRRMPRRKPRSSGCARCPVEIEAAPPTTKDTTPSIGELQKLYDQRSHIPARFHDMSWSSWFRINSRMVHTMSVGRVFLGGDSAHIQSPAGAQGINTGMQDMVDLAWKLAMVLKGQAKPETLETYEAECTGRSNSRPRGGVKPGQSGGTLPVPQTYRMPVFTTSYRTFGVETWKARSWRKRRLSGLELDRPLQLDRADVRSAPLASCAAAPGWPGNRRLPIGGGYRF